MNELRILEIYDSIQGESSLAGMPCTLIRLAGCPLRCQYCDTKQSWSRTAGTSMSLDTIMQEVQKTQRPLVLVTGGEPLWQAATYPLLARLAEQNIEVQVETSGAFPVHAIDHRVRRIIDIKTPDSGESHRMRTDLCDTLRTGDELKFVLCSRQDYEWAMDTIQQKKLQDSPALLLFSPSWGSLDPKHLCQWILEDQAPVRMQLQMHKCIWGAEVQGV